MLWLFFRRVGVLLMIKRVLASALVAGVALSASSARAGFVGFLSSSSTDIFNYTLRYTVENPGEQLVSGDLVTIYNVAPTANITSAVINGVDAANFSVSTQSPGITPLGLVNASGLPSQTLENVTFTYTGPTISLASKDFNATITTNGGFSGTVAGTGAGDTFVPSLGEKDALFPI